MEHKKKKKLKGDFKLKTFFVFLSVSMLFWTLTKLSKSYSSDVVFSVNYINLEISKTFQSKPIDQINASVVSTGFNLISYKAKQHNLTVDLKSIAHKKNAKYYYLPNNHLAELQSQLDVETKINRIVQDTIFVDLGINETKKVPVELDAKLQFKLGYNTIGEISISPKYISITGPKTQLDTIDKLVTKKLELYEVSSAISEKIDLHIPAYSSISVSESEVLVVATVDRFTEGSLTLPFSILNAPSNHSIITFPDKVEVKYQVALSNFNKITEDNMEIVCDFKQSNDNGLTYLTPKLKAKSGLITSVRFVPEKIEFLINKK